MPNEELPTTVAQVQYAKELSVKIFARSYSEACRGLIFILRKDRRIQYRLRPLWPDDDLRELWKQAPLPSGEAHSPNVAERGLGGSNSRDDPSASDATPMDSQDEGDDKPPSGFLH